MADLEFSAIVNIYGYRHWDEVCKMQEGDVRPAAVAGLFYPETAEACKTMLAQCERHARQCTLQQPVKAMILPHAGWIYSGPIAASATRLLHGQSQTIRHVVLLGPSHRVAFSGLAQSSVGAFQTPCGNIPLNEQHAQILAAHPAVKMLDVAHAQEHSLEVILPFLQRELNAFDLTPLVVGEADAETVASVLHELWGGPETLVVVSSDLSHYLPAERARRVDEYTAGRIERMAKDLRPEEACGCRAINGLMLEAQRRALVVQRVDLRNSADTAGDPQRVVGYGSFVLQEAA